MSIYNFNIFSKFRSIYKIYNEIKNKKKWVASRIALQRLVKVQNENIDLVLHISKLMKNSCQAINKLSSEELSILSTEISLIVKKQKNKSSYLFKNKSELNHNELFQIYDYLKFFGLYALGLKFRDTGLNKLILSNPKSLNNRENILRLIAMMQYKKIFSLNELEKEIMKLHFQLGSIEMNLKQSGAILFGDKSFLESLWTQENQSFAQYLKNKSIAIVGPIEVDKNLNDEIDSHDVVIRFNFDGKKKLDKKNKKGTKLSVTYFNKELGDHFDKTGFLTPLTIDWLVYKKKSKIESNQFAEKKYDSRSLYFSEPSLPVYGTFNLLPICIADLIMHGIYSINIYAMDLQLTPRREKNYYPEKFNYYGNEIEHLNISNHDPISQFDFVKILYEKKF